MEMKMRASLDDALTTATASMLGRHRIWPQGSGRAEAILHQHFKIDHANLVLVSARGIFLPAQFPGVGTGVSQPRELQSCDGRRFYGAAKECTGLFRDASGNIVATGVVPW